jgi:hypothetical protein
MFEYGCLKPILSVRVGLLTCALIVLSLQSQTVLSSDIDPLSKNRKEMLITDICAKLQTLYPFEDIGRKTYTGLEDRWESGKYDEISSPKEFAAAITADMESFSKDKHLDLYFDPVMSAELRVKAEQGTVTEGPGPSTVEQYRLENFGFRELRILDGNVGYLDLRLFFASKYAGHAAVSAMDFLSECSAIIIDLRRNGGGWDDMVTLLASYFNESEEPELVALTRSRLDSTYFASMLQSFVPGRKMTGIPVYILISSSTASAAEAFTSIIRSINDQVVLVGENTAGAENPVEFIPLDDDFVLKIPCYETITLGSRDRWEGVGLEPDITVSSDKALETAHMHALKRLSECQLGDIAQKKITWALDGYRALLEPPELPENLLQSYAGTYRGAVVTREDGNLFLAFDDGAKRRLLPIKDTYFAVQNRDDLRIIIHRDGEGTVTAFERKYSDEYSALHPRL